MGSYNKNGNWNKNKNGGVHMNNIIFSILAFVLGLIIGIILILIINYLKNKSREKTADSIIEKAEAVNGSFSRCTINILPVSCKKDRLSTVLS